MEEDRKKLRGGIKARGKMGHAAQNISNQTAIKQRMPLKRDEQPMDLRTSRLRVPRVVWLGVTTNLSRTYSLVFLFSALSPGIRNDSSEKSYG